MKLFVFRYVRIFQKLQVYSTMQLLSKEGFHWTTQAQNACDELKKAVSQLSVLAVPDFTKSFTLETDASSKGPTVVLLQEGRPLAFQSQAFSDRAQQKSVYERELMAIVSIQPLFRLSSIHFSHNNCKFYNILNVHCKQTRIHTQENGMYGEIN